MELWKLMETIELEGTDLEIERDTSERGNEEKEESEGDVDERSCTTPTTEITLLNLRATRNILHICASNNQNSLLVEICTSEKLPRCVMEKALMTRNAQSVGRTVLDICNDEETILRILAVVDISKMEFTGRDGQGMNIFHNLAQRNFRNDKYELEQNDS